MPTIEEKMNEIAQAYCTERNSHKGMDSELIEDVKVIAIQITKEYAEEHAIAFLESIRDYEHESGTKICQDERESKEFYDAFITPLATEENG